MKKYPISIFLLLTALNTSLASDKKQATGELLNLSFAELGQLRFSSAASLTDTEANKVPASVTRISREMIESSGARSLDEVLEMFVPNLIMLGHRGSGQHFGIRGIISDLDNKSLLLVNGREMNHKSVYGVITERFISALGDIDYIDVVRGPGSALYGPGAINGVIDIHTLDSSSFEGGQFNIRQGFIEDFSNAEIKYSLPFSDTSGLFLYYGVDRYRGADPKDSPLFSSSDTSRGNAGEPIAEIANYHATAYHKLRHKFHLDFKTENFQSWLRYTKGGQVYLFTPKSSKAINRQLSYEQLTFENKYHQQLTENLVLNISAGFDSTTVFQQRGKQTFGDLEEEINAKVHLNYTPDERNSFALGVEYSRGFYGSDTFGLGQLGNRLIDVLPFETDTWSFLTEYQWNMNDDWTLFLGGRTDKNKYSDWLFSPKVAMIFTPNDEHSIKLIYNQSVRRTDDRELLRQIEKGQIDTSETEEIKSVELRHDYQFTNQINMAYSLFYYSYDLIAFTQALKREAPAGTQEVAGIEIEFSYREGNHEFALSHGYTQLLNMKLDPFSNDSAVSSEPYGYGNDLLNWSPNITKAQWKWNITEKLAMNSSLQIYWGFSGASDFANYNRDVLNKPILTNTDGRQDAFQETVFLNTGFNYNITDKINGQLNLHNILGWFEEDLNKKNRHIAMGEYRIEAPAVSLALEYRF